MSPNSKTPRHFIVTFGKDGEIENVSVSTGFEIVYEGMFKRSQKDLQGETSTIEHGINVIIFGCFWLEACTNNVTEEVLWRSLGKNPMREIMWQLVKKSSILEKLKIIGTLCTPKELEQLESLKPRVRKTFDLRNRLAHFRAEEESVTDSPIRMEQMIEIVEAMPESELMSILTDTVVMREHASTVQDCANWLESVRSSKQAAQ